VKQLLFFLVAGILVFGIPSYGTETFDDTNGWTKYGEEFDIVYYYRPDSISLSSGPIVRVWEMSNCSSAVQKSYREVDCVHKKSRSLQLEMQSKGNPTEIKRKVVGPNKAEWSDVQPNTMEEQLLKAVCTSK